MTKDDIIRQIEDVRRQRAKTERQLIARGRGYPVHNDAEVELTLDEYHYTVSATFCTTAVPRSRNLQKTTPRWM